jgi:hypothetical protein
MRKRPIFKHAKIDKCLLAMEINFFIFLPNSTIVQPLSMSSGPPLSIFFCGSFTRLRCWHHRPPILTVPLVLFRLAAARRLAGEQNSAQKKGVMVLLSQNSAQKGGEWLIYVVCKPKTAPE